MKNGGKDTEAAGDETRMNSVQNEKIRRYARFFRRFGQKNKGQKASPAKQLAKRRHDSSLDQSTELSEYESIMSEILDFSNFDDSPKRKLSVEKKTSLESTKDSVNDEEQEDDGDSSSSDADELSCGDVEVEPASIASNLPVSSGSLR